MAKNKILEAMSMPVNTVLTPKLFFGQEGWQEQFPDKEIVFPENIVLPTQEQLQQSSAMTGKNMAQALNDGNYIVIVIPEFIDGQTVNLKLLHEELFPEDSQPRFYSYEDSWYKEWDDVEKNGETFYSQSIAKPGRLLIAKLSPLENSFSKNWQEQQATLPGSHRIPNVAEEVIKHFCHYLLTGEYINRSVVGRTTDVGQDGLHVHVGGFGGEGLSVGHWDDDHSVSFVGLAVAWEF